MDVVRGLPISLLLSCSQSFPGIPCYNFLSYSFISPIFWSYSQPPDCTDSLSIITTSLAHLQVLDLLMPSDLICLEHSWQSPEFGCHYVISAWGSHGNFWSSLAYQLCFPAGLCQLQPVYNVVKLFPAPDDPILGCHPKLPPLPVLVNKEE